MKSFEYISGITFIAVAGVIALINKNFEIFFLAAGLYFLINHPKGK